MKKHIITALLITTMISMTACGKNNTDTPAEETVVATSESVENPTANDEKVVLGTVNKEETATAETTAAEEKTDAKVTATPDPKATEASKSTPAPETTAKPKSTTKPGTQTASVTATTKPAATEKPKSTTAPKTTATPAPKSTTAPAATATPKATQAPAATAKPVANTPTPTAAPVACQHIHTHVENGHDTENVPIAGGCYEVYNYSTTICNDCGANLGEAKNKVNEVHHGCVITEGVSATCTTDGRTTVWGCDCGGSGTTGGDVIPAFGHDYVNEWDHDETDADGKDHVYFHSICRNCGDISSVWEE